MCGIVYLTYHISDLLTKFLTNSLPKPLIDNTNDKAVLITGIDFQLFLFEKIYTVVFNSVEMVCAVFKLKLF